MRNPVNYRRESNPLESLEASHTVTELQSHKATKSQSYKVTRSQSHKSYKVTKTRFPVFARGAAQESYFPEQVTSCSRSRSRSSSSSNSSNLPDGKLQVARCKLQLVKGLLAAEGDDL